ncbi:hypothetical protein Q2941_25295 [Bradyrhizobium sp. UFLA05-153]|uniref:hypothetical protein n=1 Tax=Bradyrhizobium sp. Ec3.3 TaxID=189753 RepID=UPI000420BFA3|nr:hypothetical protein [Bradyrhizobium sp. Ec3.3]
MSEDFSRLDEFFHAKVDAPDEAFDLIFMLDADDWVALDLAWSERPAHWRRDCAYVLHYGPPAGCIPLLQRAIFDLEEDVAIEAAISLSIQLRETGHTSVSENVGAKFIELAGRPDAKDHEELQQLVRTIDSL